MYNREVKQRYIDSLVKSLAEPRVLKRVNLLFERIEGAESEAGADISEMDFINAEKILKSPGVLRPSVFYTSVDILFGYVRWCVLEELTGPEPAALRVVPDGLDAVRDCMVSSDSHLESLLNLVCDKRHDTSDMLLRGFAWLVFAGVHFEDIGRLTADDLLWDDLAIKAPDKTHKLSRFAMPSMEFLAEADSFSIPHPQYKNRKRAEGTELMRGTMGIMDPHDAATRLRKKFLAAKKEGRCQTVPTPTDIWKSGLFSEMRKIEMLGFVPDFAVDVDEYMSYKTSRMNKGYSVNGKDATEINRRALLTRFLEDYSRWKLAFQPRFQ